MENATDALIMAGSILLLIIALTLSISSFSRVKTQIDDIVLSREKVEYAVNSENNSLLNFIQSNNKKYTRTVTFETIATSLRRLRKEEFDVYIIFKNSNLNDFAKELQTELNNNSYFEDIQVTGDKTILKFSISGAANKYLEDRNSDNFDKSLNLLYNKVVRDNNNESKKFKEYYGVYKQKTDDGVSNIEKKDIKIITYVEED